jgi:hypothetical protein
MTRSLSRAGALAAILVLCGASPGDDLAARLEGALLEDERQRQETCEQALPDQRRLWPACVMKLELEFEILAGCFRHITRLDASRPPHAEPPSLAERDRRVDQCQRSAWRHLLAVQPGWLAPAPGAASLP